MPLLGLVIVKCLESSPAAAQAAPTCAAVLPNLGACPMKAEPVGTPAQETVLNNIGTPVLSLATGFLKSNPAAAQAAKAFAGAPATRNFIDAVSSIAVGFAPAEKAALVRLPFCRICVPN